MDFFRKHWYDIGGIIGIISIPFLFLNSAKLSHYQLLMWFSLVSLFLHQFEEYRLAGTFPGMVNRVMFNSDLPDRYPLNSNTSLIINVYIGWVLYFLAAVTAEHFIWLGMAAILVSLGNIMAHTFVFNIKGKTIYNAGLVTSWLCFIPCVFFFFRIITTEHLSTPKDFWIGIPLGVILNIVAVFKLITWLKDRNTIYVFDNRQLLPNDRLH